MSRYLFIGIFGLGLAAAAIAGSRKLDRVHTRTDELATVLPPLKQQLPGATRLYCYLEDKSLTEALIRGRFVLAPLVLVPVRSCNPGDTILLILKPGSKAIARGRELWSYTDTTIRYSLVHIQ